MAIVMKGIQRILFMIKLGQWPARTNPTAHDLMMKNYLLRIIYIPGPPIRYRIRSDLVGSNNPTKSGRFPVGFRDSESLTEPTVGSLKFPMISDRQNPIFISAVGF
jgi:hypothetical protein